MYATGPSADTYQFPKTIQILSVPEDMTVANDFLSYRATYRKKVSRILTDLDVACAPKDMDFPGFSLQSLAGKSELGSSHHYPL